VGSGTDEKVESLCAMEPPYAKKTVRIDGEANGRAGLLEDFRIAPHGRGNHLTSVERLQKLYRISSSRSEQHKLLGGALEPASRKK
jgi:hypothetical protein